MRIYQSELQGTLVELPQQQKAVCQTLSINYDNGKVLAVTTNQGSIDTEQITNWQPITARQLPAYAPVTSLQQQKVYSQAGAKLGKLVDCQIDTDQLVVTQIVVKKTRGLFSFFKSDTRMIPISQVSNITTKKITIFDEAAIVFSKKTAELAARPSF